MLIRNRYILLYLTLLFSCACSQKELIKHELPEIFLSGTPVSIKLLGHTLESSTDDDPHDLDNYEPLYDGSAVIVHPYNPESLLLKLQADFATGQAPDIFAVWPGDLIKGFIEKGLIMNLTPYLQEDRKWFERFQYSELWDPVTFGGNIYGLPVEGITEQLMINKEIFDREELHPPHTFDQLLELCLKLNNKGITPLDISGWLDLSFLYQSLIAVLQSEGNSEDPKVEALYKLIQLYEAGGFNLNNDMRQDTHRSGEMLMKGEAAMMINGSWAINEVHKEIGENLILMPFPQIRVGSKSTMIFGLGSTTYYISEDPTRSQEELDELINLAKHLTNSGTVSKTVADEYILSNIPLGEKEELSHIFPKILTMSETHMTPPDHGYDRLFWYENILYRLPLVLNGKLTPEQLWEEGR